MEGKQNSTVKSDIEKVQNLTIKNSFYIDSLLESTGDCFNYCITDMTSAYSEGEKKCVTECYYKYFSSFNIK